MMTKKRTTEWLDLSGSLTCLHQVGDAVARILDRVENLDDRESVVYNMTLAAHELCTNIITHAYADKPGPIRMGLQVEDRTGRLIVDVFDEAPRVFDMNAWQPPNLDDPQERGLGVWLIHQLMDEVIYHPQPRANHWRLIKRLPTVLTSH